MSSDHEHDECNCQREFAAIHVKLDRLDEAIRGNGRVGILLRLDRLESAEVVRSKLLWIITASVLSLAITAVWKLVIGS